MSRNSSAQREWFKHTQDTRENNHIELSRLLGEGSEEENARLFIYTFTPTLDEGRENLFYRMQ